MSYRSQLLFSELNNLLKQVLAKPTGRMVGASKGPRSPKSALAALLQFMAVLARKTEASVKFTAPFVVLPNLVEPSLARQAAQRAALVNVAFGVTIEFQ